MIKLGVSGDLGSFSEEAALLYAKQRGVTVALNYLINMEGVLAALDKQEIELGILPVVNLNGGLVKSAIEAMGRHLFIPIDEIWFNVNQCLLVLPGTDKLQITRIVSHPQGLAQCKHYIEKEFNKVDCVEWCDTAKAAKDLAQGRLDASCAVIAPERAAQIYSLEVVAKGIQNRNPNLTAFILVKSILSGEI